MAVLSGKLLSYLNAFASADGVVLFVLLGDMMMMVFEGRSG
jgi:hypothetical protein